MGDSPENPMRSTFHQTGSIDVPVDTLDRYSASKAISMIDLLKTDTQGFDLEVLKGAETFITDHRVRCILLEINLLPMYDGQGAFSTLHSHLTDRGYRLVDFYNQVHQNGYTAWADALYIAAPAVTCPPPHILVADG